MSFVGTKWDKTYGDGFRDALCDLDGKPRSRDLALAATPVSCPELQIG